MVLSRRIAPSPLLNCCNLLAAMPVVDVVGGGTGDHTPRDTNRHVAGQVRGNHGSNRIQQGVEIHFAVEKPKKRDEQKRRPIPREGEAGAVLGAEFFELLEITLSTPSAEFMPKVLVAH